MQLSVMKDVMLGIAGAHSTASVLDQIVEGIADCRDVALARIWLIERKTDDRGADTWLQLAASAGNLGAGNAKRLDGRFARFEMGERKIGHIGATGEPVFIRNVATDDRWIADPAWATSEGIRCFIGQPLIARGQTLGVLGVFDRTELQEDDFEWLRTFADHAAVAIWNAEAFEEIERLRSRLERENAYLREEVDAHAGDMLGSSAAMEKIRRQIELVGPTEAGVLVLGESGVGKELVARAVHESSRRAGRPLVKVNCGAVPGQLFESEFFGHVKGAFTGASRDRVGRFELANGGTIFLDEVGEIPLEHQAKLLRVLQEGTYERVGDEETRTVDVRIIAATNRDLAEEARQGRFRQDLYYRLGVFPIDVPSLRDRGDDVVELADHFVAAAAARLGLKAPRIPAPERRRLLRYSWPGNVRELQHVVERAVILAGNGPVQFPSLDQDVAAPPPASAVMATPDEELPTLDDIRALEREVIRRTWEEAGRKVSGPGGAAERLGLKPSTLTSRLRALGLK